MIFGSGQISQLLRCMFLNGIEKSFFINKGGSYGIFFFWAVSFA